MKACNALDCIPEPSSWVRRDNGLQRPLTDDLGRRSHVMRLPSGNTLFSVTREPAPSCLLPPNFRHWFTQFY